MGAILASSSRLARVSFVLQAPYKKVVVEQVEVGGLLPGVEPFQYKSRCSRTGSSSLRSAPFLTRITLSPLASDVLVLPIFILFVYMMHQGV